MIRHRPFGRGHPYLLEPDQRVPVRPVVGEPIELRATTGAGVSTVTLELDLGGHVRRVDALPAGAVPASAPSAEGHLAVAAARAMRGGRRSWVVSLDPLPADTVLRYRFVGSSPAGEERTRWFSVGVSAWQPTGGRLNVDDESGLAARRIVPDGVRWLTGPDGVSRVRFGLRLQPGEHVVGFGERFDALDQRGRRLDAVVFEQYRDQGNRTYLPVPFAIVVGDRQPWGFHVATSRRTWYDVGASVPDVLSVEAELDPADREPRLGLVLFAGDPAAVLRAFLERTGPPLQPPDWVFRPWMSGNEWNTQARVLAEVARSRELGIPVGVVVIEAWSDESTFVAFRDARYEPHADGSPHQLRDFTFPADGAWPDPRAMVEGLHAAGVRVLLWQVPLLKAGAAPGSQAAHDAATMTARGYAVRQADGRPYRNRGWWFPRALLPDFTKREAADWWLAKRRYLVEEVGIDGFKTDGGEHAWGHDLRYGDGTRGEETNNRYPVLYAAAYHRLLRSVGRDPVTFSRAGFTGASSVPCHWAGDERSTWEAFRASITAGLTAGASGVFFWGWDLAGFSGELPSAELYLRAAAMACFSPIMQFHSEFNFHRSPSRDRTPWNLAEQTGDERVVPGYRFLARLRERLVPYLAGQARRSIERGAPLMRALCFEWPSDPRIWAYPFQYLLGDDLLVAPVTDPGLESLPVYLPAGDWLDGWTGEALRGPVERAWPAPLGAIPVFLRPGAADGLETILRTAGEAGGG